jgi:hypothetical protein
MEAEPETVGEAIDEVEESTVEEEEK